MKKYIFILSIIVLGLLPSCYSGDFYGIMTEIGQLETLSPNISDYIVTLRGDYGDLSSDYAFFQIGRTKDFSGQDNLMIRYKENDLPKNYLNGTYYYRLCLIAGNDTVYAPDVQSFTVDQMIEMREAQKLDGNSAVLSFTSSLESGYAKVLLSTDKEFKEYDFFSAQINGVNEGGFDYSVTVEKLTPGVTYYAKASIEVLLGTIESYVISFTTENQGIKAVTIYGNDIDGQTIKSDLMVVIKNLTTNKWSEPYHAVYNDVRKSYDIQDLDYIVEPDTWYVAYAVNSTGTTWDNSGYVVFGQGDYQYGADQIPIYWGVSEIDGSNPYLKLELTPWTSRITVEYPASWGQVDTKNYGLAISDKLKQLPGSSYDIITRKPIQNNGSYFGKPSKEATLSADGSKYSFTFNIFPTKLSSADCSMILYLLNDKKDVPCPNLDIQMGKNYTISFDKNDLNILDVAVKEWESNNGGSITIKP